MAETQRTRRTRFVCISDTHNHQPKLPHGDVLIHAGDITNQGSYKELSKMVKWLEDQPFEAKIVIAGNHDITLDKQFYSQHGLYFHNQNPESHADCLSLFTSSSSITYLDHTSAHVHLTSPDSPGTHFRVFGSPYSPLNGLWAFSYPSARSPYTHTLGASSTDIHSSQTLALWDDIPLDTDILVTHTPARTHRDEKLDLRQATGCERLREVLWRVRPRMAVCGHVHDGRGAEIVRWDLGDKNVSYAEEGVKRWGDPGEGNKKISLVDLTGRKGPRLDNDGGHSEGDTLRDRVQQQASPVTFSSSPEDVAISKSSIVGKGGRPSSGRSDREALAGRLGRRETAIINAAIMKSKYPHTGGKQYYKPIVVDIELPVWQE